MKGDSKIRPMLLEVSGEQCTEGAGLRAVWWDPQARPGTGTGRTVHISGDHSSLQVKEGL